MIVKGLRREQTHDSGRYEREIERDIGVIESITKPTMQGKNLFTISKHSQALDETGNDRHEGVFQQGFNEIALYILMMCKFESNSIESHNIGYTFTYTNDRQLAPQRSH